MDTLFDLPVMDIIAGFIVVLVALFLLMTRIAWQQWNRAKKLEAELFDARISCQAWNNLAQKQLKKIVELSEKDSNN